MINKEKKTQVELFGRIQKAIPANQALVDVISEHLKISTDAAYRRIRGDKMIDIAETISLCKHFGISLDSLTGNVEDNIIQGALAPSDLRDMRAHLVYLQNFSTQMERLRLSAKKEILLSVADFSVFDFLANKELVFFHIFSWNKNLYDIPGTFENFMEGLAVDEFLKYFSKIVRCFQFIPTTEIWTTNSIDSSIKLLRYHTEMNHFSDKRNSLFICEQLLNLLNTLQSWVKKGTKEESDTPFKFYVSEIDIGNTLILIKNEEDIDCLIRLFTINGLNIKDKKFCKEADNWIHNLIKRSTLLSGSSDREGLKFFEAQKQKVRFLIDAIS